METKRVPVSKSMLQTILGIPEDIVTVYYNTEEDIAYFYVDGVEQEKEDTQMEFNYAE